MSIEKRKEHIKEIMKHVRELNKINIDERMQNLVFTIAQIMSEPKRDYRALGHILFVASVSVSELTEEDLINAIDITMLEGVEHILNNDPVNDVNNIINPEK